MKSQRVNRLPSQLSDLIPVEGDRLQYNEYYNEECTRAIRQLLVQLVDKRLSDSLKKTDDPAQLTNPSYPCMQAYQSGYRQALTELKDLINR